MTTQNDIAQAILEKLNPLVDGRVYARTFPQDPLAPVWPSIRYTFISVAPNQDICGDGGEETADYRLQIDVVMLESRGPTAFSALCKQVRDAMAELKPVYVWDGQFEDFDMETKTSRLSLDYLVYLSSPE